MRGGIMATRPSGTQDLIYDVGMNIAEDTRYYLAKGFRVIAIEANPLMVEKANERYAAEIRDGRLTVIPVAVGKYAGCITFFVCDSMSALSTTVPSLVELHKRSGAVFREVVVNAVPFADILRVHGVPHYLKVDIEGCDLLCLKALAGFVERPSCVSVEIDFAAYIGLIETAASLGYKRFQVIPQTSVINQHPPVTSQEGNQISYSFFQGCTGLFGTDLPDAWKGADETVAILGALRREQRMVGAVSRLTKPFGLAEFATRHARKLLPRTNDWYDLHMMA
jgi:FkbM family methyltransferase